MWRKFLLFSVCPEMNGPWISVHAPVACRGLWMPGSNSYETSWLDAPRHPFYIYLSIIILCLNIHLNIEIRWIPGDATWSAALCSLLTSSKINNIDLYLGEILSLILPLLFLLLFNMRLKFSLSSNPCIFCSFFGLVAIKKASSVYKLITPANSIHRKPIHWNPHDKITINEGPQII